MEEEVEYITKADASKLNSTFVEITICPICKGSGVVSVRRHYGHTSGWLYDSRVCEICDGKGRLRKTTTEQYSKLL